MQYQITVKPGSSQEKIVATSSSALTVYLHAHPHDGEANAALIAALAKYLKVPKTSIKILRGTHSRQKLIEITHSQSFA